MAARLAELVEVVEVEVSHDGCETILFNGADALARNGHDPTPLVEKMKARAFSSAEYVIGSYFYHQKRDLESAKKHLRNAERSGVFTKRTARLLAKIYMQEGDARSALEVIDRLGEQRVNRDSGLLSQKIRCLRGMGRRAEADQLMPVLKSIDDDYGEYENLLAAKLAREARYREALEAIARARDKPKSNTLNLALLDAATRIDAGMEIDVEEVCNIAIATGRLDDARSLRGRAALREGKWADAEEHLERIRRPNYFDKVLMIQALEAKTQDMSVRADPTLLAETTRRKEQLLVETRVTPLSEDRWSW